MPHTILDCDGTQVNLHYIDGELPDEQYPLHWRGQITSALLVKWLKLPSGCIIQRVRKIKRL